MRTSFHKVLIVDDEPIVAFTLTRIFEAAGYDAMSSSSAEEALEVMASWSPALAIVDVVLPGMNGVELMFKIKKASPECAVILLSGCIETNELLPQAQGDEGLFDAVAKPIPPIVLLELSAKLLSK